jgi:hypothetical protein
LAATLLHLSGAETNGHEYYIGAVWELSVGSMKSTVSRCKLLASNSNNPPLIVNADLFQSKRCVLPARILNEHAIVFLHAMKWPTIFRYSSTCTSIRSRIDENALVFDLVTASGPQRCPGRLVLLLLRRLQNRAMQLSGRLSF